MSFDIKFTEEFWNTTSKLVSSFMKDKLTNAEIKITISVLEGILLTYQLEIWEWDSESHLQLLNKIESLRWVVNILEWLLSKDKEKIK